MSAARVLAELAAAGVALAAEGERLRLGRPPGAPLYSGLLSRISAAKPALLLVASGRWRVELDAWSSERRADWAERVAIREHEGHQPRDLAERAAFLDVLEADPSTPPVATPARLLPIIRPPSPWLVVGIGAHPGILRGHPTQAAAEADAAELNAALRRIGEKAHVYAAQPGRPGLARTMAAGASPPALATPSEAAGGFHGS